MLLIPPRTKASSCVSLSSSLSSSTTTTTNPHPLPSLPILSPTFPQDNDAYQKHHHRQHPPTTTTATMMMAMSSATNMTDTPTETATTIAKAKTTPNEKGTLFTSNVLSSVSTVPEISSYSSSSYHQYCQKGRNVKRMVAKFECKHQEEENEEYGKEKKEDDNNHGSKNSRRNKLSSSISSLPTLSSASSSVSSSSSSSSSSASSLSLSLDDWYFPTNYHHGHGMEFTSPVQFDKNKHQRIRRPSKNPNQIHNQIPLSQRQIYIRRQRQRRLNEINKNHLLQMNEMDTIATPTPVPVPVPIPTPETITTSDGITFRVLDHNQKIVVGILLDDDEKESTITRVTMTSGAATFDAAKEQKKNNENITKYNNLIGCTPRRNSNRRVRPGLEEVSDGEMTTPDTDTALSSSTVQSPPSPPRPPPQPQTPSPPPSPQQTDSITEGTTCTSATTMVKFATTIQVVTIPTIEDYPREIAVLLYGSEYDSPSCTARRDKRRERRHRRRVRRIKQEEEGRVVQREQQQKRQIEDDNANHHHHHQQQQPLRRQ